MLQQSLASLIKMIPESLHAVRDTDFKFGGKKGAVLGTWQIIKILISGENI